LTKLDPIFKCDACHKSAYTFRSQIRFEGTKFQEPCTYSFLNCKDKTAYSEVFLPDHVDEKFKNREVLWNAVEQIENRKNSQVSWEMVFALPDDECVTLEDRIELCQRFVKECFVSYGSAVQVDIHYPTEDKNWHAHFQGTLREFDESGKVFLPNKMRDGFIPQVRNGKLIFPENWVKYAVDLQNSFFKEKGYDITVDPAGMVTQKHIGPQRFRGRSQSLIEENELRKELNREVLKNPKNLLDHITKSHSIFDYHTVDYYVQKIEGLSHLEQETLIQSFWKQEQIIPLFSENDGKFSNKYTTQTIVDEEKSILRNAERIKNKKFHKISYNEGTVPFAKHLRPEQKEAFKKTIEGDGLVCINGLAGTGKSTLLEALKNLYEESNYTVRGMGPDTATCSVLKGKGFESPENIHRFLFNYKHGHREVVEGHEVWIVDESSKIGNTSLNELLKVAVSNQVKVIFTGDISQLSPVERGTAFCKFCEKFGFVSLDNVQRQEKESDREIVKLLSGLHGEGTKLENTRKAIDMIENQGGFHWDESKVQSIKSMIRSWAISKSLDPTSSSLLVAYKKDEVNVLNDVVRLFRKRNGELGEKDYLCKSATGTFVLSEGDRIRFKRRDNQIGVENGDMGIVKSLSPGKFVVEVSEGKQTKTVEFSPEQYSNFQLGYVSTNFGSQGVTFDRSFIMCSPQMRLDAFYVARSRHIKSSDVFVSEDEIGNLSTLKSLATRGSNQETTIGLLTKESLEAKEKLEGYKNSNFLIKRAYGQAREFVSKWDIWSKFRDSSSDGQFYRPGIDSDEGLVLRVIDNHTEHPTRVITNNSFVKSDSLTKLEGVDATYNRKILKANEVEINPSQVMEYGSSVVQEIKNGQGVIDREIDTGVTIQGYEFIEELFQEVEKIKAFSKETPLLSNLSFEKAKLVSEYHLCVESCHKIRSEDSNLVISEDWKRAVITRNRAAYSLTKSLSKEETKSIFDQNSRKELQASSQKQKSFLNKSAQKEMAPGKSVNPITPNHKETKGFFDSSGKQKAPLHSRISTSDQKLVDRYLLKVNEASVLHGKAQRESEERGISKLNTSVSKEWFGAASERNQAAKQMTDKLAREDLLKVLSDVSVRNALTYASKCKGSPKNKLEGTKQKLVDDYQRKSINASKLYKMGVAEAEEKRGSFKNTSVFHEFLLSSGARNEAAYRLNQILPKDDIATVFTKNQTEYLKDYVGKFEANREFREKNSPQNIEKELKSNMESLCLKLFPDGYSDKNATSFRYGNNGSLSVNVAGPFLGSFHDFEGDESGGPLALIKKVKECSFSESMKYAKDFLGICDQITVPKSHKAQPLDKQNSWMSVIPPVNSVLPTLEEVNPTLAKKFDEVGRYKYCDEKGDTLFCILRLEPKEGGAKQMRPLSYGFDKKNPSNKYWSTVGYQSEYKAIYGLEKMYANPKAHVLIVEGEKTADAASRLLEKEGVVVISWVGGTGSVDKVDWSLLRGRKVTIWPDNDKAGAKAANSIICDLRKHGVSFLKLVEPETLEKLLPQKWDLADKVPKELNSTFVKDTFMNAREKYVSVDSIVVGLKPPKDEKEAAIFKSFVSDILYRVDNRLREELEKEHGGRTWEIKNKIIGEVSKIVGSKDEVSKSLQSSGIQGEVNKRLTSQFLYTKASKGVDPTSSEIQKMKKSLKDVGHLASQSLEKELPGNLSMSNLLFDKAFLHSRESGQLDNSVHLLKNELTGRAKIESVVVVDQLQRDMLSSNQPVRQRQLEMEM